MTHRDEEPKYHPAYRAVGFTLTLFATLFFFAIGFMHVHDAEYGKAVGAFTPALCFMVSAILFGLKR